MAFFRVNSPYCPTFKNHFWPIIITINLKNNSRAILISTSKYYWIQINLSLPKSTLFVTSILSMLQDLRFFCLTKNKIKKEYGVGHLKMFAPSWNLQSYGLPRLLRRPLLSRPQPWASANNYLEVIGAEKKRNSPG